MDKKILKSKWYYRFVYTFLIFSFIAMPFLMFGFNNIVILCPDGEEILLKNYSKEYNISYYEKKYCKPLDLLQLENYGSETPVLTLPPLPSAGSGTSNPIIMD